MKFLKNNLKVIIAFIIGIILASSVAVYAATINAKDVDYKDGKTVEYALNDLYSKSNKTPQQVATLISQGATYTMQNDGYIIGTAKADYMSASACIYFNGTELKDIAFAVPYDNPNTLNVSLYVTKDTVVKIRENYGTYDLTVYEWK